MRITFHVTRNASRAAAAGARGASVIPGISTARRRIRAAGRRLGRSAARRRRGGTAAGARRSWTTTQRAPTSAASSQSRLPDGTRTAGRSSGRGGARIGAGGPSWSPQRAANGLVLNLIVQANVLNLLVQANVLDLLVQTNVLTLPATGSATRWTTSGGQRARRPRATGVRSR